GDEVFRLSESFAWISRNGHDLLLWRGNACDIFGFDLPEEATLDHIFRAFTTETRALLRRAIINCLHRGESWDIDLQVATPGSTGNWLHASGTAMDIEGVRYLTGVFRNETRMRHMEDRLAMERRERTMATQLLAQLLDVLPNAIAAYDPDDRLIFYNRQYKIYYHRAAPAIRIGERYENILRYAVENGQYAGIDPAAAQSREWMQKRLERHRRGMKRDLVQQLTSGRWVQVRERKSDNGYTVLVSTDITDIKQAEERIREQAEHDPLTGLLNRSSFMRRFEGWLQRRREGDPCCGCFILFDLDHFKSINDTLGHQAGDELLRQIADRLAGCTRSSDLSARLGGDEFAAFLPMQDTHMCDEVVRKVHAALTRRISLEGRALNPGVSMGVTIVDGDDLQPDEVIRRADTALFHAKAAGRNGWRYFDQALQERFERRRRITAGLREAIATNSLQVALQPQISFGDEGHVGFEVLARWEHEGRMISPAEFIPIAEDAGLMMDIGCLVMKKALAWYTDMKDHGLHPGRLAVNISPVQLKCQNFFDRLEQALADYEVTPEEIEFEITETALIGRDESLIEATLQRLAEMGFSIALDDFGTGNATFAHLKRFPIHRLKIDKLFVDDIGVNADNTIITQAIINLAHNLGMEVVAEGIETEAQRSFLRISGCDIGQGYLFSRPLTPDDAEIWLKSRLPDASGRRPRHSRHIIA
ncbi:MAG TPA: EAL domain-containing protein, partial [Thermopetrobacter sp.]|nr:EAL domain-containing protein [Thermopetrobacter sp.]